MQSDPFNYQSLSAVHELPIKILKWNSRDSNEVANELQVTATALEAQPVPRFPGSFNAASWHWIFSWASFAVKLQPEKLQNNSRLAQQVGAFYWFWLLGDRKTSWEKAKLLSWNVNREWKHHVAAAPEMKRGLIRWRFPKGRSDPSHPSEARKGPLRFWGIFLCHANNFLLSAVCSSDTRCSPLVFPLLHISCLRKCIYSRRSHFPATNWLSKHNFRTFDAPRAVAAGRPISWPWLCFSA